MQGAVDFNAIRPAVRIIAICALALVVGAAAIYAQQTSAPAPSTMPGPQVKSPAGPPIPPSAMQTDWPNLKRYHEPDAILPPPVAGVPRVVFMGDSITEAWKGDGAPANPPDPHLEMINRGISGQTTPQMTLRFQQDVIDLKPSVVVILAGTNDIAGNTGDMTEEETEENLASMADQAHADGIRVVLCSILPVFDYPWKPGRHPAPKIVAINTWMKEYAASHGYIYVDFYSAMVDDRGGLPPTLSVDGVHPTKAGFAVMTPIVEAGIARALSTN
jgi:lysophospholipase L1-like esterase